MKGSQGRAEKGKMEDVWKNAPVGRRPSHRPTAVDESGQKVSSTPGKSVTHTAKTYRPKIETHIYADNSGYISWPFFYTYTHPGGESERESERDSKKEGEREIWVAWCDSQTGLHTPSAPSALIQPHHTIRHTHTHTP